MIKIIDGVPCQHAADMSDEQEARLRKLISSIVEERQGLKQTEIFPLVAQHLMRDPTDENRKLLRIYGDNWLDLVDDMISKRELIAVEYLLAVMPERLKTFLLPKGTLIADHTGGEP